VCLRLNSLSRLSFYADVGCLLSYEEEDTCVFKAQ